MSKVSHCFLSPWVPPKDTTAELPDCPLEKDYKSTKLAFFLYVLRHFSISFPPTFKPLKNIF